MPHAKRIRNKYEKNSNKHGQPKVRSQIAIDAWNGAGGVHKDQRVNHKTDRAKTRRNLRQGDYE
jgi:hypothetical protein